MYCNVRVSKPVSAASSVRFTQRGGVVLGMAKVKDVLKMLALARDRAGASPSVEKVRGTRPRGWTSPAEDKRPSRPALRRCGCLRAALRRFSFRQQELEVPHDP